MITMPAEKGKLAVVFEFHCEAERKRKRKRKRHRLIAVASTATTQLNRVEPKAYNGAPGSRYTVHV